MSSAEIRWNDGPLKSMIDRAEKNAIDETTMAAVTASRDIITQKNIIDTGHLLNTMEHEPARRVFRGWEGKFGNWTARYAIYLEIGTVKMSARPFIQPALDMEGPKLVERMRRWIR